MKEVKCESVDIPGLFPGWSCCKCKATGAGTYNGNNRSVCKICSHPRCAAPDVIKVPVKEDGGVRIIPVKTKPKTQVN